MLLYAALGTILSDMYAKRRTRKYVSVAKQQGDGCEGIANLVWTLVQLSCKANWQCNLESRKEELMSTLGGPGVVENTISSSSAPLVPASRLVYSKRGGAASASPVVHWGASGCLENQWAASGDTQRCTHCFAVYKNSFSKQNKLVM